MSTAREQLGTSLPVAQDQVAHAEAAQPEAGLVTAASSGDLEAFGRLVSQHRVRVIHVAYGVLASIPEAEDVAQEVFVKAWHRLPDYHGRGSFSSWLYRITVNTAIDVLRKRREEIRFEDEPEGASRGMLRADGMTPEETLLRRDDDRCVRQAIASLPPGARVALVLREYEQMSYKEIAATLDIPMGTVMSRLNYARKLLRDRLADHDEGADVDGE